MHTASLGSNRPFPEKHATVKDVSEKNESTLTHFLHALERPSATLVAKKILSVCNTPIRPKAILQAQLHVFHL